MSNTTSFLAKSKGGITLHQHTDDVVGTAHYILEMYGSCFREIEKELLMIACEVHDYGKVDENFQFILKGEQELISETRRHEAISSLFLDFKQLKKKYGAMPTKSLVSGVYYSHHRPYSVDELRDYCEKHVVNNARLFMSERDVTAFNQSQKLHFSNLAKLLFCVKAGVDETKLTNKMDEKDKSEKYQAYLLYVTIVGLLNKADYHASARRDFPIEKPIPTGEKGLPYLVEKEFVDNGYSFYPAQQFLLENRGENVILIAPAGSGKTEGSLLWLGEQKGFYTLPIKVSSNAIFNRIRRRYNYSDVALLHSDALTFFLKEAGEKESEIAVQKYGMMKNLSYPMTVCTVDQIFKFIFKALGTEILAATLKYSCVIVDEIQMYSPEMMAFLCYGLKMVNDLGGKFLIMTATLPQMVMDYFEKENIVFKYKLFEDLKAGCRHRIRLINDGFDYVSIIEQSKTKKVLVLCNTVAQAQQVFTNLNSIIGNYIPVRLLHSNFIKNHRQILETDILSFAENGKQGGNGIWILMSYIRKCVRLIAYCNVWGVVIALERILNKNQIFISITPKMEK